MSQTLSTAEAILREVDARVAEGHLLKHPFYQAWSAGELSPAALRDYAAQYYHHVAAFPTYLSAVHAQTGDQSVRREILQNLMDEEAGSPNHPQLWLQFAERLGVPAAVAEDAALWPETKALIERFRAVCRDRGTAAGLAALYAYESQVPEVSESKIDGLRRFYGFADAAGYEYFRVHIKADREHSGAERRLLAGQVNAGNREAVLHAVDEVVTSLNGLLSGVCDRHDICQTARA